MSEIWVWVEQFEGQAAQVSWEALAAGRKVADAMGASVSALVLGSGVQDLATAAAEYGADKVLVCDDALLADWRPEPYAATVTALAQEQQPAAILAGATSAGRDLLALVATDLEAGLIPDCVKLEVEDGNLVATRPVYAGKLMSKIHPVGGTVLISLRSRAWAPAVREAGRTAEIVAVAPGMAEADVRVEVLGLEAAEGQVSLTDAGIVVSGGRGVGGPEGFAPVRELALALGAALGASRAAVDAGWIPYAHQVGQTGKTVSPDLYIACGISGAIQHLAGMRTAKVIVAINKDPEAPIFKLAQYGVVADLFKIVPALTAELKKRL